jgi:hypothetical protein
MKDSNLVAFVVSQHVAGVGAVWVPLFVPVNGPNERGNPPEKGPTEEEVEKPNSGFVPMLTPAGDDARKKVEQERKNRSAYKECRKRPGVWLRK